MRTAGGGRRRGIVERFLEAYSRIAARAEPLVGAGLDPEEARHSLQRLFHRLLADDLILRRGWAGEEYRKGGLPALWNEYLRLGRPGGNFCLGWLEPLHLECGVQGGPTAAPDEAVEALVDGLFRRFHFTDREGGACDAEDSLGPEVVATLVERRTAGRHEKGSYYTPRAIVAFMVRRALACYLETSLPDEPREAVARLVEQHEPEGLRDRAAVLEALRRVKVCDPSCGGGAFLARTIEELLALRICVGDRVDASRRLRAEILRDNLHGVELEADAVEVARLRLWLGLLADWEGDRPPPFPGAKIEVGDSLQQFDWPARFPEPSAEGGFDIVLMNPPYLLASRVPGNALEQFRRYGQGLRSTFGFSSDLYVYFFYLALRLLKPGGVLCALTSASFLTNATKEHLRRELLRHDLRLVAPLGPELFDAHVYPAITLVQKGEGDAGGSRGVGFLDLRRAGKQEILEPDLVERRSSWIEASEYRQAFGAVFFDPTAENRRIFRDLLTASDTEGSRPETERDHRLDPPPHDSRDRGGERAVGVRRFVRLGEVAPALDTGIHSGNVRERLFYRDPVPDRPLHRLLQGTQVVRYGVWWDNPEARYRYVDLGYRIDPERKGTGRGGRPSARREYWHFCGSVENHHVVERLLMRQTGDAPLVGYLYQGQEQLYTDNTLHTLLLSQRGRELGFSYLYLLALLNSGPLARIYRALAQEEGRMLAQVKTAVANHLPLPVPKGGDADELETLVGEIQGIHRFHGLPLPPTAVERVAILQRAIDRLVGSLYGL